MVKKFGIVFIAILISGLVMLVDSAAGQRFIDSFLQNQSLEIVATVIALNIATITFLVGTLMSIEQRAGKLLFTSTRKELKDNVIFMFAMFAAQLLIITLNSEDYALHLFDIDANTLLTFAALLCITLVFVALADIVTTIFSVSNFLKNKSK